MKNLWQNQDSNSGLLVPRSVICVLVAVPALSSPRKEGCFKGKSQGPVYSSLRKGKPEWLAEAVWPSLHLHPVGGQTGNVTLTGQSHCSPESAAAPLITHCSGALS